MKGLKQFLLVKAAESVTILLIYVLLLALKPTFFFPHPPDGIIDVLAGWIWLVFFCYVLWGYLFTSAIVFFAAGRLSSWKPQVVAIAAVLGVVIHQAVVMKIFLTLDTDGGVFWVGLISAALVSTVNWVVVSHSLRAA